VEGVNLIFLAILVAQSVATPAKGVAWRTIDPFCGKLQSSESKTFPLEKATAKLYRAKYTHLRCCEGAEPLGDVKFDRHGYFDLRKLPIGQYWIVSSWDEKRVPVPVWANKKCSYACDKNPYTSIELKPNAETFEITMHTTNNQTTVNAQTH
jgi:hypothetical protein